MYIDAVALGQEQPCSLSHLVVAHLCLTLRVEVDSGMASFLLVGQPTGRLRSDLLSISIWNLKGMSELFWNEAEDYGFCWFKLVPVPK
ncbi:hypothetical protein EJB05_05704, partial [Eragrostis curvula]